MHPPFLPDAPWTASQAPGSQAITTPEGYFLLDLEGLDTNSPALLAIRAALLKAGLTANQ